MADGPGVILSPETIRDVAKHALKPGGFECDWDIGKSGGKPKTCQVVLGSWDLLRKHIHVHCRSQRKQNARIPIECRLPRCNFKLQKSCEDLEKHVDESHLSRISLDCPIRGCGSVSWRLAAFPKHFEDAHKNLSGGIVRMPSDLLLPSSEPFPPSLKSPPPLPNDGTVGTALVNPTKAQGNIKRGSASENSPLPRRHGFAKQTDDNPDRESSQRSSRLEFDDLDNRRITLDLASTFPVTNFLAIVGHRGRRVDLARPQPMLDPDEFGNVLPPKSILYEVFARQVTTEENVGVKPEKVGSLSGPGDGGK
ncbi:hypothetical protein K443DRAFT_673038 [Laccaria amethystina LaAM-08-1]|uniref:C2H2-type domain-containing protein n=1 Tax=Laccaria amethystina LaAM-08-1 TaxID=1095629 RepID=A0A0C9YBU8_9AGAR|nr:hypothetical protein K443DRAFT_673038 [Laccaria amethystina LaAM-08-1]